MAAYPISQQGDAPGILRLIRPGAAAEPLHTIVHHQPTTDGYVTSATRIWEDRTAPTCGGLCAPELCKTRFVAGACQVVVPYFVPAELCARLADRPGG